MVYIERTPHPALAPHIRCYWHACDPCAEHGLERVLPAGHLQIVMSLARDYLTDCNGESGGRSAAAILGGIRSRFQMIDVFDMAELIGVVFRPGGTTAFFAENAGLFADADVALEDLWGKHVVDLRERLREASTVAAKFAVLEGEFLRRISMGRQFQRPAAVSLALAAMHGRDEGASVDAISRQIGLSSRRLSEIFREQVGASPKLYQRILRFQRAVRQMHSGADVRWTELALDCGYYDQSHFANDFREFSGINPTTYSVARRVWSNHVPVDSLLG